MLLQASEFKPVVNSANHIRFSPSHVSFRDEVFPGSFIVSPRLARHCLNRSCSESTDQNRRNTTEIVEAQLVALRRNYNKTTGPKKANEKNRHYE
jgi:hypothetical protein